jgi:hypothetical protein
MGRVTENTKSRAPHQRANNMPPATRWRALGELNARRAKISRAVFYPKGLPQKGRAQRMMGRSAGAPAVNALVHSKRTASGAAPDSRHNRQMANRPRQGVTF